MFRIKFYFGDTVRIVEYANDPWHAMERRLKAHGTKITKVTVERVRGG